MRVFRSQFISSYRFVITFSVVPLMTLLTPVLVPMLAPPSFKAIIDDIHGDAPTVRDDDEMHAVEAELRDGTRERNCIS